VKRLFVVLLFALVCTCSHVFGCPESNEPLLCEGEPVYVDSRSYDYAEEHRKAVQEGRLKERTNMALNAIIRYAAFKLKKTGHKKEAEKLIKEWEGQWSGYIMRVGKDIGDHAPLSMWLKEKTDLLTFILGIEVMKATRLWDLVVFNHAIPVVFSCIDDVDEVEFGKHFVPLMGSTAYWVSFFVCVGGTWGSGFLFCGPISWGSEFVVKMWIAPSLNPTVWDWSCH